MAVAHNIVDLKGILRHHRGNRVAHHQLGDAVARKGKAAVVGPGHGAAKLDAVGQEHGHGRVPFHQVLQEGLLQGFVGGHIGCPGFCFFRVKPNLLKPFAYNQTARRYPLPRRCKSAAAYA